MEGVGEEAEDKETDKAEAKETDKAGAKETDKAGAKETDKDGGKETRDKKPGEKATRDKKPGDKATRDKKPGARINCLILIILYLLSYYLIIIKYASYMYVIQCRIYFIYHCLLKHKCACIP